jgi:hydroxyacylglutathione hydrolase
VGNCKHGGDVETLYKTIRNIYSKFSDDYILYPGHDYIENNLNFCLSVNSQYPLMVSYNKNKIIHLKQEREINPFLNEVLLRQIFANDTKLDTDKKRFLKLRSLRDSW